MAEYTSGKKTGKIFILEIWLDEIKPRIWRKLAVRPFTKLDRLHMIIQESMGWTNSHLHQFITEDGNCYSYPYPGYDSYNEDLKDETEIKLSDLLTKTRDRIKYQYDFGDCWDHIIELTSIERAEPGKKHPMCLAGERACPPEDCGGPWGYEEMLETLASPDSDEKRDYTEWLGGTFQPEKFDVEAANRRLRRSY